MRVRREDDIECPGITAVCDPAALDPAFRPWTQGVLDDDHRSWQWHPGMVFSSDHQRECLKVRRSLNSDLVLNRQFHQALSLSFGSHCPQKVGGVEGAEGLRVARVVFLKFEL